MLIYILSRSIYILSSDMLITCLAFHNSISVMRAIKLSDLCMTGCFGDAEKSDATTRKEGQ